jgi:hypothetical protein
MLKAFFGALERGGLSCTGGGFAAACVTQGERLQRNSGSRLRWNL